MSVPPAKERHDPPTPPPPSPRVHAPSRSPPISNRARGRTPARRCPTRCAGARRRRCRRRPGARGRVADRHRAVAGCGWFRRAGPPGTRSGARRGTGRAGCRTNCRAGTDPTGRTERGSRRRLVDRGDRRGRPGRRHPGRRIPDAIPTETLPPGTDPSQWAALRDCESGGDYSITNPSGKYRGAYQFDRSTWDSVASRHALGAGRDRPSSSVTGRAGRDGDGALQRAWRRPVAALRSPPGLRPHDTSSTPGFPATTSHELTAVTGDASSNWSSTAR